MNEVSIPEQLSALADGELDREAARFLVRRIAHEPQLKAQYGRYHLIRACLRREPVRLARPDFASQVMAALDAPDMQAAVAVQARPWRQRIMGGAIAAGVALMALYSVQPAVDNGFPAGAQTVSVAAMPSELQPMVRPQQVAGHTRQDLGPVLPADDAMQAYLVRHSGAVGSAGGGLVAPFAYVPALPRATGETSYVRQVAIPVRP